ncbi:MAG: DUF222 domain-containing protein, partial [Candidatus Nanopelagicales bacterium]
GNCRPIGSSKGVDVGEVEDVVEPGLLSIAEQADRLLSEVGALDGRGASDMLLSVPEVIAKLDSLQLALVSQIDESGIWREDPNGTLQSYLRRLHGRDHRQSARDVRAADFTKLFPQAKAAADAGKLSRAHIDVMVAVGMRSKERRGMLGDFLHIFIELARTSPASVLRTVMRKWAMQVDPLPENDDELNAYRRRTLTASELGDGVFIEGFFDKVDGAKVLAVFNGILERHRQNGAPDRDGNTVPMGVGIASQQRADAFINQIIDPMLSGENLPETGKSRAAVTLLVTLSQLQRGCGASADPQDLLRRAQEAQADGQRLDLLFDDGVATMGVSNGPGAEIVSPHTAQRLTCDCDIHRIVIDPNGLPIDVGRDERTFPAHLRRMLEVRDKGCVFTGCSKPAAWSEAHHIKHWAQGGRTSLENAALLCSKHHHEVHANGHTVFIGSDGRAKVTLNRRRVV